MDSLRLMGSRASIELSLYEARSISTPISRNPSFDEINVSIHTYTDHLLLLSHKDISADRKVHYYIFLYIWLWPY
jgi:hypothetical protein